jgi:hypothetical protein
MVLWGYTKSTFWLSICAPVLFYSSTNIYRDRLVTQLYLFLFGSHAGADGSLSLP